MAKPHMRHSPRSLAAAPPEPRTRRFPRIREAEGAGVSPTRLRSGPKGFTAGPTSARRTPSPSATRSRAKKLNVEPKRPELLAAVVGDRLRPPWRHPHPVDREVLNRVLERLGRLLLDHVGERAGRAGQRHVQGGLVRAVEQHPVDEAEVDDVDAELGVDNVAQRLEDVLGLLLDLLVGERGNRRVLGHACPPCSERMSDDGSECERWVPESAWAVASFQAIQPRSAHLIRAGYFDTPANATASSRTSSSGSSCPLDFISSRKASSIFIASLTGLPITRSVMTDALAWLIEQPRDSKETSSTTASPSTPGFSATRSVTSSPQVGFTWYTCASNGSRSPLWCGFR